MTIMRTRIYKINVSLCSVMFPQHISTVLLLWTLDISNRQKCFYETVHFFFFLQCPVHCNQSREITLIQLIVGSGEVYYLPAD